MEGVNCVKTVIKSCYNITKVGLCKLWSERISTLAEVLAPWPAPAELSATLSEVQLTGPGLPQQAQTHRINYLRSSDQENDCADIGISAPSAKLI